ncbi:hypothetical protein [Holospora undulata]|uniref:Outer membrane protein beta-barrel domain-containing protein n=1 Tax=Holospora undulata HU1 TaxID=1321371 RepID=A0A061JHC1_9PROT|nr:hypothetical protein [Holospora undulata]ETZ04638.1 hypothetical protein K737_300958 [Holospora undulata HU1]
MKKKLRIISALGLIFGFSAQAAEVIPCFTPGFYFGLGAGVSQSYNRLQGSRGLDLYASGNYDDVLSPSLLDDGAVFFAEPQNAFFYGTNNITPSGWAGPGMTILPELGYVYKVPKSSFTMGVFINGGAAQSAQNAVVPVRACFTRHSDGSYDVGTDRLDHCMRVASRGSIGIGATFGFASNANHYYVIIGWNNTKFSVGPRFNQMYENEFQVDRHQKPFDSTTLATVKNVTGNINGINFGFGFDRQITTGFSVGVRVMALNAGGSKGIPLPYANYYPNAIAYERPVITVRPFVMAATVMLKYVFLPKKK